MTLEWLRRHDPMLDRHLRTYLFTDRLDPRDRGRRRARRRRADASPPPADGSLGIGEPARHLNHLQPIPGAARMNHLLRELAPISDAAWAEIDTEATRTLTHFLAARKLVDFADRSATTRRRSASAGSSRSAISRPAG